MALVTEIAHVVAVEDGHAWVETQRKAVCDACAVQKGCGSGIISGLFNKRTRIRVPNSLGAAIGQEVVIGIDDRALVRNSLAVYLMPLVWMMLGAIAGQLLGNTFQWTYTEGVTAVFGMLGLAAGFVWLRRYSHRIAGDSASHPNLLRFAEAADHDDPVQVIHDQRDAESKTRTG